MSRRIAIGHVAIFGANITWGLMAPLSKSVMMIPSITSWALVSFRVMGAAIAFWIASLFVKDEKVNGRDMFLLFIAALFAIVFNQGIFIMGVSMTSPINASIVTTTLPFVTMIISFIYLREPISWMKFLGIIVGGSGALLIILNSQAITLTGDSATRSLYGILLCFCAQFSYAVYFVVFKRFVEKYSAITLMKWMFLFASVCYIPFSFKDLLLIDYKSLSFGVFGDIVFIVLFSTFISYMLIPIAQKNLRPTVASMYNNVQPVVATIAAVIMQMDSFGWAKAIAILLIFGGVYLVNRSKARAN